MYLVDTNVLSELRQGKPQPSSAVRSWAASVPLGAQFISAISVMELEIGVMRLEHRTPAQGQNLRSWLKNVRLIFSDRVLAVDETVATRCAALHVPNPRPERDALLAATALTHGFTMVTRNCSDFEGVGVKLLNPWNF
jgi:toxin FitB